VVGAGLGIDVAVGINVAVGISDGSKMATNLPHLVWQIRREQLLHAVEAVG